jgi:hypothetical protein
MQVFEISRTKVIMITGYATLELARESLTKALLTSLPNCSVKGNRRTIERPSLEKAIHAKRKNRWGDDR